MMKKYLSIIFLCLFFCSCESGNNKEQITRLLKEKIGTELPFKEVRIAPIENGTAVIVDKFGCYWIDKNNEIYCVNGTSKTIYKQKNGTCKDAPIKATYSDINKIAK
jgi:hypothetical protein